MSAVSNMAVSCGDERGALQALPSLGASSPNLAGRNSPAPLGIDIELPLPPSVNNLFFNNRKAGRTPTKDYQHWRNNAGWLLRASRQPSVRGRYMLLLLIPQKCRCDADNMLKAPTDLLVALKLTDDDKNADAVMCLRSRNIPAGQCRLVVRPADELPLFLNIALRAADGDVARPPAVSCGGRGEAG